MISLKRLLIESEATSDSIAWAKKCELPVEKIFNKTLLQKFVWAMDVNTDWKF